MAWQTPKTNWQAADVVSKDDFNRIEGNVQELQNTKETPAGAQAKVDTHAGSKQTHGISSGYYIAKTSRSDQLPAWGDIQGKPSLVTSSDLSNGLATKVNKPSSATSGNIAVFDGGPSKIKDSGRSISTIPTFVQGVWSDTTTQITAESIVTKYIPIGVAAKKGRLVIQGSEPVGIIFFNTSKTQSVRIGCIVHSTSEAFIVVSRADKPELLKVSNSNYNYLGYGISLIDCYISGTNIVLTFSGVRESATLNVEYLYWEVEVY